MNKTALIVGLVALVAIIGGVMYANRNNVDTSGTNATSTPVTNTTYDTTTTTTTTTTTATQAIAPTVSTNSEVFPTDTTAIVNGTVNPEGALTSYRYEYGNASNNLGSKTVNQTVGSGFIQISAPAYITGLSKNTLYYFRLVAENQYGSVAGNVYSFNTTTGNPAPVGSAPTPKTLSATGISKNAAYLNGEVTTNKASTQSWFEYGTTADFGSTSAFSSPSNSSKYSTSQLISGLDPLTKYYFRLNAQNQFGTTNGSTMSFKTAGPSSAKAPAVTTGSATDITSSGATLHGTVIPNELLTSYWFEYSTDSLFKQSSLQSTSPISAGAGTTVVPLDKIITGLNSNTAYYFRVVAQNSLGTVRGNKATFVTK